MSKLPIFDERSILKPQQVASGAKGAEDVSQLFGAVGKEGVKIAGNALEAESKAHLYMQSSLTAKATNDYELSLKKDPNPKAGAIHLKTLGNIFGDILKNSTLNNEDRLTLQKKMDNDMTSASKALGVMEIEQAKKSAQLNFAQQFPDDMRGISKALFQDPKEAQKLINNTQGLLEGMFRRNELSEKQWQHYNKLVEGVVDRASSLIARGDALDLDAEAIHTYGAFLGDMKDMPGGAPINVESRLLYSHYKSETDYKSSLAELYKGKPDAGAIIYALNDMTDTQFTTFLKTGDGIAIAKGKIDSAQPIGVLEQRVKYLREKSATLTEEETGELNKTNMFLADLKNDFRGTIQDTPQGQAITAEYMSKVNIARDSVWLGQGERDQMEKKAANEYMSDVINYGRAIGAPSDIVQPFDAATIAAQQSYFNPGADAKTAINKMKDLSAENGAYLAYGMKKPNQQQVMLMANIIGDDKQGLMRQMVYANQNNTDFSVLNYDKSNITESKLKAKIVSQLSDVNNFLGHQPQGSKAIEGVYDAALNMVKYLAVANGDLTLKNSGSYINDAIATVKGAYKFESGSFYSFNTARQPMSSSDANAIAGYAREQAINRMRGDASEEQIMEAVDRNPLFVSMDESGEVNVIDSEGEVRWKQPYTEVLLGNARLEKTVTTREIHENRAKYPAYVGGIPSMSAPFTGKVS